MIPRLTVTVALAVVTLATMALGQGNTHATATRSTDLHRAWMLEILDLDSRAASKVYAQVAADRRPRNLERWVAAARLTELQRLDVDRGPRIDFSDAPTSLRRIAESADTTLDIEPLIQRTSGTPDTVLLATAAEAGRLPPLRPIVATAESWLVDQLGQSRRERWRSRMAARADNRPAFTARLYAGRVLYSELEGERSKADERRSLYFTSWEPPRRTGDPTVELARIGYNLDQLLLEREWTGFWRRLHHQLHDTVDELAVEDPEAAIALVRRLPQYAERLLVPVPEEER